MTKPLKELLAGLEFTIPEERDSAHGNHSGTVPDIDICAVINDGRKVQKGCLFICCRDTMYNGSEYIEKALCAGASVIVTEESLADGSDTGAGPLFLYVPDARYAMAFIYAAWYDHPADKLTVIGITGTKGKTTTAYMLRDILQAAGHRTGLIGTVEYIIGDEHIEALNTTPEAELLQSVFSRMVMAGLDSVVMEVSSTALKTHRSQGFIFDTGIFTNIGDDHIGGDECIDFDQYLYCKGLLLKQCHIGIVNRDDPNIERVLEGHTCAVQTFGLQTECDYRATDISYEYVHGAPGVSFCIEGYPQLRIRVPMPGGYTVSNALAAAAAALHMGISAETIVQGLSEVSIPGRTQMVQSGDCVSKHLPAVIVDYAHNPMSLEALLKALRFYYKGMIICVFGSGGNRIKDITYAERRAQMGQISTRLADLTVITSDNPHFEDPGQIIEELISGIRDDSSYVVIPDRKEAIHYAISQAGPEDVVAIAGKGHEKYQEIQGIKYPCNDAETAKEALRKKSEQ